MIPEFFEQFNIIQLEDKQIFDEYFIKFPPEISEYTFTNLFMWRNYYQFRWIQQGNQLILLSFKNPEFITAFPPIGDNWEDSIEYLKQLQEESQLKIRMERIPETLMLVMQDNYPNFTFNDDRDNHDYVYQTSDFRDLSGGDLFNERKKLNKFKRTYNWEYIPLTTKIIGELLDLQAAWCEEKDCNEDISLQIENQAVLELMDHWPTLGFTGGAILIDKHVAAYTLGEKLTPNTMVTHLEKADTKIFGLYQAVNQQYAEVTAADCEYINREQDLGIPNLRYAKTNYHPIKMVKKYVLNL